MAPRGLRLARALAAALVLVPPAALAAGPLDAVLVYTGPRAWTAADFAPYVARLDPAGGEQGWFFDAVVLLQTTSPSGRSFQDGSAGWGDWLAWLEAMTGPQGCLAALDQAVEAAGVRLGDPSRRVSVVLMVPFASGGADDQAARLSAQGLFVEQAAARFAAAGRRHLDLWGFYWLPEAMDREDEGLVRALADRVHRQGHRLLWIPWFRALGWERWREFGFDAAVLQPGYAFLPPPPGALAPDEGLLTAAARLARGAGLGLEVETAYRPDQDPADRLNLQLYLHHAREDLDGAPGPVRAWFQSWDVLGRLARSDRPADRALYRDAWLLHQGALPARPLSLLAGAAGRQRGRPAPELTDGRWPVRADQVAAVGPALAGDKLDALTGPLPALAEVRLAAAQLLGEVRVHLVAHAGGEPLRVAVEVSEDGARFVAVGEVRGPTLRALDAEWAGGFAQVAFPARPVRAVRVQVEGAPGQRAGIGEVLAYPVPHRLAGRTPRVLGAATGEAAALTDGRVGAEAAVRFGGAGGGALRVEGLDGARLTRVLLHASWPRGAAAPRARVRSDSGPFGAWAPVVGRGEGWAALAVDGPFRELEVEVAGAGAAWDELQVREPENLAQGRPYWVARAPRARYPDPGGALLDGRESEDFRDGRAVGWSDAVGRVSVFVDLREPQRVDRLRLGLLGGGAGAVLEPLALAAAVSVDGVRWESAALWSWAREERESRQEPGLVAVGLTARLAAPEFRWLRLDLTPSGWLMLSELELFDGERRRCASPRCPYALLPAPSAWGDERADRTGALTDGLLGAAGAVRLTTLVAAPEIEVDLLAARPVRRVRLHSLVSAAPLARHPSAMTVAVSPDGGRWTSVRVSRSGDGAWLEAELPQGTRGRFVAVRLELAGAALLDELQVQ